MTIRIDVWFYGELAKYGGEQAKPGFANLYLELPEGATVADLLKKIQLPTEERGITFINGLLSAMPGVQPDLSHILQDGDRVAFFHLRSMWPFQYRHGASMIGELAQELSSREDKGIHHDYRHDSSG